MFQEFMKTKLKQEREELIDERGCSRLRRLTKTTERGRPPLHKSTKTTERGRSESTESNRSPSPSLPPSRSDKVKKKYLFISELNADLKEALRVNCINLYTYRQYMNMYLHFRLILIKGLRLASIIPDY